MNDSQWRVSLACLLYLSVCVRAGQRADGQINEG